MKPKQKTDNRLRDLENALAQIDTADIPHMRKILRLLVEDKITSLKLADSEF